MSSSFNTLTNDIPACGVQVKQKPRFCCGQKGLWTGGKAAGGGISRFFGGYIMPAGLRRKCEKFLKKVVESRGVLSYFVTV
jgi:hypothetical protein